MKQIIAFVTLVLLSSSCASTPDNDRSKPSSTVIEKRSGWLSTIGPTIIYGRVVDQFGEPVVGAEVIMEWRQFTLDLYMKTKSDTVTTDGSGRFVYKISGGVWPIVSNIDCDGYELIRVQNSVMKLHYEKQQEVLALTTPSNPVILKLRKRGEATLLLNRDFIYFDATARSNQLHNIDLVFMRRELSSDAQIYKDIQTEITYIPSNSSWMVKYRATNNADGLIVSDEILYTAPDTGYQKEVVLINPTNPLHIYLRSRNPVIFSRIDAKHVSWQLDPYPEYRISIDILTNPYGSRNLEYDVRYEKEWEIKERLVNEAKSFLARKQYPPIPDLDALIANQPSTD